jgi:hypothetical protein
VSRQADRFVRAALILGAVGMLVPGVWAFVAPAHFAREIALFEPYNRHYLHDVGAFQIGLGVAALLALRWRNAVAVGLGGLLVANAAHTVSHTVDRDLGGRPTDIPILFALAALAAAGLVARVRTKPAVSRTPPPGPGGRARG